MTRSWREGLRKDEPVRVEGELDCPDWLAGIARSYWNMHLPALVNIGVISAVEVPAFAMLCQRFADWMEARQKCETEGRDLPTVDREGAVIGWKRAPWDMRERDLYGQYFTAAREFGLTPVSRTGVKAIQKDPMNANDDDIT